MVERAKGGEPGGSLVFCGSLSMFHGISGIGNYAAAKGGMAAVIRGIAAELGKYGIRANTVAPGYIKTGFMEGEDPALGRKSMLSSPPRRQFLVRELQRTSRASVRICVATPHAFTAVTRS